MDKIRIDWQKCAGLVPCVTQDAATGEVLMLAFMDEEAYAMTRQTGFAHYFSRSKGRIWKKGEESGNVQRVREIRVDCDNDAVLLRVEQTGAACHTGEKSCFFREVKFDANLDKISGENLEISGVNSAQISEKNSAQISNENSQISSEISPEIPAQTQQKPSYHILDELYHTILERKLNADPSASYVAKLFAKGENAILKKICEEAGEFALACKDASSANMVSNLGAKFAKFHANSGGKFDEIYSINVPKFGEHKIGEPDFDIVYEGADILFHLLVALAAHNIAPDRLMRELARREGKSGIDEKNSRKG